MNKLNRDDNGHTFELFTPKADGVIWKVCKNCKSWFKAEGEEWTIFITPCPYLAGDEKKADVSPIQS